MQVSLSEIETSICKAVSAVNLPLGFGEDAGRAARCMAESGIGSLAAFVDALDALDNGQSTGFDTESAVMGEFIPKSAGQYLSALHAGPSACDLLVSAASTEPEFRKITLNDVDIPLVILFVSLVASTDMNMGLHLLWSKENNIEAVCWQGSLIMIKGTPENLCVSGPTELSILLVAKPPKGLETACNEPIQGKLIDIDEVIWRRIIAYTSRLLVEATKTSRLTGAGAGVIDMD